MIIETYEMRLINAMNELHDLHEDAQSYADDLEAELEGVVTAKQGTDLRAKIRSVRAVEHKVEEALGALNNAHGAAVQGDL